MSRTDSFEFSARLTVGILRCFIAMRKVSGTFYIYSAPLGFSRGVMTLQFANSKTKMDVFVLNEDL
jgi:hypothetical protein